MRKRERQIVSPVPIIWDATFLPIDIPQFILYLKLNTVKIERGESS